MTKSRSIKKINKRKKYFTIKNRTHKMLPSSPSIIRSIDDSESNYNLSINRNLNSFRPTQVEPLVVCNLRKAFRFEEKLQYKLNGKCYNYDTTIVKNYLINRLKNNDIVSVSKIIAPKQIDSNCWFNSMFMMFFISDRGRIFFHYMRELMINGKALNTKVDAPMRDAFALLNFIIECCLSGNSLALNLNTNKIIKKIYQLTKESNITVYNINEAGNPIIYYQSLIKYLGSNELKLVVTNNLKEIKETDPPHIIIMEFFFNQSKMRRFSIGKYIYELDSASVIDLSGQHFCSLVTCNGIEFAFDGYSKSRLIPFEWKSKINKNMDWGFKDNIYEFEDDALWNFLKGYSCLCYYRVK